ncbi:hypothetical protein GCM10027419_07790 [Pandoraea terrae]
MVGRFGLVDGRFVLEEQRLVLGRAALVAEDCAGGGQDGRHHRDAARKAVGMSNFGRVLKHMVVGTVYVKFF